MQGFINREALAPPDAGAARPTRGRAPGWSPIPRRRALRSLRPGRPAIAWRVALFVLAIPLLVGVAAPPAARGDDLSQAQAQQKALTDRIKQQRAEVAQLRAMQAGLSADMSATTQALAGVNANLAQTKAQVTRLTTQIAKVRAVYTDLVAQVAQLDVQVGALEREEMIKEQQLLDRKALLAARVREAYRTDRTPLIQQLLAAGSLADVVQDVGAYIDFGTADQALAAQIQSDQQALDTMRATLVDTRAAKESLRLETLTQKQQLDARVKDLKAAKARLLKLQAETARQLAIQKATWTRMQATTKNIAAAIARDQAAQRALAAKIQKLLDARQFGNIPSQYNGTLQWPASGVITQEFGCTGFPSEPPVGNCAHFHQGIDIAAPMYTPIRAAGDGVVVFAGPNPYDPYPKAWIVIIAHSDNLLTWYAHVDNAVKPPVVVAGQQVSAGQVIAYIGMTGRTTGPHLHWAVEFNDGSGMQFVNPRAFV